MDKQIYQKNFYFVLSISNTKNQYFKRYVMVNIYGIDLFPRNIDVLKTSKFFLIITTIVERGLVLANAKSVPNFQIRVFSVIDNTFSQGPRSISVS